MSPAPGVAIERVDHIGIRVRDLDRALGCRELYSEDMSHGQEIEGVIIINPFR